LLSWLPTIQTLQFLREPVFRLFKLDLSQGPSWTATFANGVLVLGHRKGRSLPVATVKFGEHLALRIGELRDRSFKQT
jgi:hypothetical protein